MNTQAIFGVLCGNGSWGLFFMTTVLIALASVVLLVLLRPLIYSYFGICNRTDNAINGFFAGVGVLYGLLIGMVVISVWGNFQDSQSQVHVEAGAYASLARSIAGLPEPTRSMLHENVSGMLWTIINKEWPEHSNGRVPDDIYSYFSNFEVIIYSFKPNGAMDSSVANNVIERYLNMLEIRRDRVYDVVSGGLPQPFWIVLVVGTSLAVIMTFFFHVETLGMHILLTAVYSTFLGLMIFLIVIFDRSFGDISAEESGQLVVSPRAFQTLLSGPFYVKESDRK